MQTTEVRNTETRELQSTPGNAVNEGNKEVSLLELLTVIGESKEFILKFTLIITAVAVCTTMLLPKRYTASTTLLPPQQGNSISSALFTQLGTLGPLASMAGGSWNLKNPNDLYVSLLRSRSVEDAVISRFALKGYYHESRPTEVRKQLERHCSVESDPKDGLIRISIEDRDPQHAAALANGYVEEYKKFSASLAVTEAGQRRLFFEQQLAQAKNNLAAAEEDLKRTEQKTGVIQLDSQARALIESVASLRAQIAAKEVQIRAMSSFATGENPDLVLAKQQLDALKAQLGQLGGNEAGGDDLIVPKGKVPEAGLEYVRKLREVKYQETIFEVLAKQYEAAKIDEARQGTGIQVVDVAVPPDIKSFPPRLLISIIAFISSLIIAVFWVTLRDAVRVTSHNPERALKFAVLKRAWTWQINRVRIR